MVVAQNRHALRDTVTIFEGQMAMMVMYRLHESIYTLGP
jgi:hypothetical protein